MTDTDIVTDLRKRHANCTGNDPRITPIVGGTIFQEAADEIERLRHERDDLRRAILESLHPDVRKNYAAAKEWDFPDCFNTPKPKVDKTLKGVIIDGGKAVPPKYEDLDNG